jgi:hypothetical protein
VKINKGRTPSQMIRHTIASQDNRSAVIYHWSAKGRSAYRAQWLFLRSSPEGLATVRAGLDAISCSANASWFEWLEGSALFSGAGASSIRGSFATGNPTTPRAPSCLS